MTKTVRGDSSQGRGGVATGVDVCCHESSCCSEEEAPRLLLLLEVENAVDDKKLETGELPRSLLSLLPPKPPPTSAGRLDGKGVYPASSSQS